MANSVVQVTALKGSGGGAVVSYVRGKTGRFEDSSSDLPARFSDGGEVTTGVPEAGPAASIALSHNFGLYVLTGDGARILECESYLVLSFPNPLALARLSWRGMS